MSKPKFSEFRFEHCDGFWYLLCCVWHSQTLQKASQCRGLAWRDLSEADRDGFSSTRSPNEHLVIWIQERKFDDRPNPIVVNQSVEHSIG